MKFIVFVGKSIKFVGRLIRRTVLTLLWLGLLGIVVAIAGSWWTIDHLQLETNELPVLTQPEQTRLPGPIKMYSADNKLIGSTVRQRRTLVNSRAIAPAMKEATVAIEDQRFYEHRGVDVQALGRAVWIDLRKGGYHQGASTLTMQYIKNIYLDQQKTTQRKLREIALALQLESLWTKDRILTAYLNTVYYGNGAYGVEAAAQEYFRTNAESLTVAQAAMLAGITNDPTTYDPRQHFEQSWRRGRLIVDEMFAQNRISRRQWVEARANPPKVRQSVIKQQVFDRQLWEAGLKEAQSHVSEGQWATGNLTIRLTLNISDQQRVRRSLNAVYKNTPSPRPVIAATFVNPGNGRVVAMASSRSDGYFDYARQALRQPGSTVKLFTTGAYLAGGGMTTDAIDNSPLKVVDGKKRYTVQPNAQAADVGTALRFSQNPAFWRLYQKAGPKRVLKLERSLGLAGMDDNPAAALGGVKYGVSTMQMAGAVGGLANEGSYYAPHVVQTIENDGKNVYVDTDDAPKRALAQEYSRRLNVAAKSVVNDGLKQLKTSVKLSKSREIAGKTGTTEDNGDAWFVGYAPNLAGAVWTGYAKSRRPLKNVGGVSGEVFGATVPAKTWNTIATGLFKDVPRERFARPEGIKQIPSIIGDRQQQGADKLAQFGLRNIKYIPVFNPRARVERILSVSPKPGLFVKPNTQIKVRYQQSSRPTPAVVGKTYLNVYETLGRYVKLEPRIVPSTKPTGTILAQYPLPGETIEAGDTLQLTLSTRRAPAKIITKRVPYVPTKSELAKLRRKLSAARASTETARANTAREAQKIVVPDVVGLVPLDAGQVLSSLNLVIGGRTTGRIVTQRPAAGTRVQPGTRIAVTTRLE